MNLPSSRSLAAVQVLPDPFKYSLVITFSARLWKLSKPLTYLEGVTAPAARFSKDAPLYAFQERNVLSLVVALNVRYCDVKGVHSREAVPAFIKPLAPLELWLAR